MRDYDFRFVGSRHRQLGGAGAGGLGSIIWSAVDPPPGLPFGYKRADLCTPADITGLRTAGVLPNPPQFLTNRGYGAPVSSLSWDGSSAANTNYQTAFVASGDGWLLSASPTGQMYMAGHNSFGGGVRMGPVMSLSPGGWQGLSYANGEFNLITNVGIFAFSPWAKSPNNAAAVLTTRYGTTAPSGLSTVTRLYYYKGLYIAYNNAPGGGGPPLRYSSDRLTWTLCTCPPVNAASGGIGNSICSLTENPVTGQLIGVSGYGEIFTTNDGITWTKTFTIAAGGATALQFGFLSCTPSGKLFAGVPNGGSATWGSVQMAPNVNSAFTQVSLNSVPNFGSQSTPAVFTAYFMDTLWAVFPSGGGTAALVVGSRDEGATWFVALFNGTAEGSMTAATSVGSYLSARDGFIWMLGGSASPPGFIRIDFDWGHLTAPRVDMITGAVQRAYVKVA